MQWSSCVAGIYECNLKCTILLANIHINFHLIKHKRKHKPSSLLPFLLLAMRIAFQQLINIYIHNTELCMGLCVFMYSCLVHSYAAPKYTLDGGIKELSNNVSCKMVVSRLHTTIYSTNQIHCVVISCSPFNPFKHMRCVPYGCFCVQVRDCLCLPAYPRNNCFSCTQNYSSFGIGRGTRAFGRFFQSHGTSVCRLIKTRQTIKKKQHKNEEQNTAEQMNSISLALGCSFIRSVRLCRISLSHKWLRRWYHKTCISDDKFCQTDATKYLTLVHTHNLYDIIALYAHSHSKL